MSSRSSSAIIARAVSGRHLLKIDGYSHTKVVTNASYIQSCTFDVGGHSWRINYYPNGLRSDSIDYISVFIQLVSISRDLPVVPILQGISAQGSLSLLDLDGKPVPSYTNTFNRSFTTSEGSWGWYTYIARSALENSGYLKDDCFTLMCDINVTELRAKETRDSDFAHLMWNKGGTDVTFEVCGETFTAHRWVLASRIPILKLKAAEAELLGVPEREKKNTPMATVRIDDMEAKVFKALLHYIYTDALPDEMNKVDEAATTMAHGLLEAADRYKMERLKIICEDMMCKHVSTSTVITTLVLAEQHHCPRLKAACINFLISPKNMSVVLENGGFKHLQRSCPFVLMDLIERAKAA
ncbi:Speckle-type POZ protein [Hordeum vulgare]|nr:Speckle-type POZ protein [Hordeum vulgare]